MTNQPRPTGLLKPVIQLCVRALLLMAALLIAAGRLDYWQGYL